MNLSDLVHRTAGDNKVNNKLLTPQQQQSSNLFQQPIPNAESSNVTAATATTANGAMNVNNVFANLNRQDQSAFLFPMANMSQTDWINSNLFFNGTTDNFIDPTIPNNNPLSPNTSNSFLNQDLSFLNQPQVQQQQQQQQAKPMIHNTQAYRPPTIAPYPSTQQQQQFTTTSSNRFDPSTNTTATSAMTPATATASAATLASTTINKAVPTTTTALTNHKNASFTTNAAAAAINFSNNASNKTSHIVATSPIATKTANYGLNKTSPNTSSRINFNNALSPSNTINRTPPTSTLNFSSNSSSPSAVKPIQFNFDNSPSPSSILNAQPSFINMNSSSSSSTAASTFQFGGNSTTNTSTTSTKTPPSVPPLLKKTITPPNATATTKIAAATPPSSTLNQSPSSSNSTNVSKPFTPTKQSTDHAVSTTKSLSISAPHALPRSSTTTTSATTTQKEFLEKKRPKFTVTGKNVNMVNIEDGYIQFVLNHDPHYISDGIDSLIHAKRKFASVPKTGDLSYTTWDIYQLVLKLHNREIKNWSQLVGKLGLADMAGRPQFAQRVKRWMHRYKIDCYFDYLLGNEYDFHASNENYSGCLMMGNHKKKKLDNSEAENGGVNNASANGAGTGSEDDHHEVTENKIPILLAGSRKRMRDHSQNSQQLIENARQFLRQQNEVSSSEEEEEEDEMMLNNEEEVRVKKEVMESSDSDDDDDYDEIVPKVNGVLHKLNHDIDEDMENVHSEEEEEELDDDEEDELASTSSSPGSPAAINSSPKLVATIPIKTSPKISTPAPHPLPPPATVNTTTSTTQTTPTLSNGAPSCTTCSSHENTISEMKKEISRLNAYIKTLETTVDQQTSMTSQMNKLLRLRDRTERWRKQLIEDLARGPPQLSDEDDLGEGETDDDDVTTQSTTTDLNGSSDAL